MTKTFVLAAVLSAGAAAAMAAEPAGIVIWRASELKGYAQKLAPKMNEKKVASETLARFGNHLTMIAHREGDGEAELHELQADVFVVQSGEATLVLGGEVVDAKTTAANEVRGPSIKDGQRHTVAAGDIVHIPAKVAHQLLIPAGTKFTYFVVKVDTP